MSAHTVTTSRPTHRLSRLSQESVPALTSNDALSRQTVPATKTPPPAHITHSNQNAPGTLTTNPQVRSTMSRCPAGTPPYGGRSVTGTPSAEGTHQPPRQNVERRTRAGGSGLQLLPAAVLVELEDLAGRAGVTPVAGVRSCQLEHPTGLALDELTTEAAEYADRNGGEYVTDSGESRNWSQDLLEARSLCSDCPLLVECAMAVLPVPDVAGVAAGMTELERSEWQAENGDAVRLIPSLIDLLTVAEIDGRVVADQVAVDGAEGLTGREQIPRAVVEAVLRLSAAGLSAEDVAGRLEGLVLPRGRRVTESTVDYIRTLGSCRADRRQRGVA